MKFAAINSTALIEIVLGAAVVVGVIWYVKRSAGNAVDDLSAAAGKTLSTTLNPASDQNAVYKSVNAAGNAMTGDSNFTLGGWVYDICHPNATLEDQQAAVTGQAGAPPLITAAGF